MSHWHKLTKGGFDMSKIEQLRPRVGPQGEEVGQTLVELSFARVGKKGIDWWLAQPTRDDLDAIGRARALEVIEWLRAHGAAQSVLPDIVQAMHGRSTAMEDGFFRVLEEMIVSGQAKVGGRVCR
jgi:hypothetical protein